MNYWRRVKDCMCTGCQHHCTLNFSQIEWKEIWNFHNFSQRLQLILKERFHCHAIKYKIKNHSVDKVKKLWYYNENVPHKFTEPSMEPSFWCSSVVHQCGSWKIVLTSGTFFGYLGQDHLHWTSKHLNRDFSKYDVLKWLKNHKINTYFSTNTIVALCHAPPWLWNSKCAAFQMKGAIELESCKQL